MEIRCTNCEHLGPAADVRPVAEGVGLVCEACGHINVVAPAGQEATESAASQQPGTQRDEQPTSVKAGAVSRDKTVARLMPEPGQGPRCRKCLTLLEGHQAHCPRCGLSVAEARTYEAGQAPWEKPPPERQQAFSEAQKLWNLVDCDDEPALAEFVAFVIDEDLLDLGVRNVQRHIIRCGPSTAARKALGQLAEHLDRAAALAQSQAQAQADDFRKDVEDVRSKLLKGALIFWTAIFLLFSLLFWDNYLG